MPAEFSQRVFAAGSPAITIASNWAVIGCPLTPPAVPCATGRFVFGALRVISEGRFLAVATGVSLCVPTGTPLVAGTVQTRVTAS